MGGYIDRHQQEADIMSFEFICADCMKLIDISFTQVDGYCGSHGWAVRVKDNAKLCFSCANNSEFEELRQAGKGALYTYHTHSFGCDFYDVGDWHGTVKIECYNVRFSHHNFAGNKGRLDMHFDFDGSVWLATRIGDQDFTRVRRTKKKARA